MYPGKDTYPGKTQLSELEGTAAMIWFFVLITALEKGISNFLLFVSLIQNPQRKFVTNLTNHLCP